VLPNSDDNNAAFIYQVLSGHWDPEYDEYIIAEPGLLVPKTFDDSPLWFSSVAPKLRPSIRASRDGPALGHEIAL